MQLCSVTGEGAAAPPGRHTPAITCSCAQKPGKSLRGVGFAVLTTWIQALQESLTCAITQVKLAACTAWGQHGDSMSVPACCSLAILSAECDLQLHFRLAAHGY